MSTSVNRLVIIGGGQAAAQIAMQLRKWSAEFAITIVGDESLPPYQRPPLSKSFLKGQLAQARLFFKPPSWYQDNDIELRLATRVVEIDRIARRVRVDSDESGAQTIEYGCLVIATGSRPRLLPVAGADLAGVCDLRTIGDVEQLQSALVEGASLVVVGGGYIGLEAAATARQLGVEVTVVEMAPRVLARVTSPILSDFFHRTHESHGVRILTDSRLERVLGEQGKVTGVRLANGDALDADLVLVGIGIVPNDELARQAGLVCHDGIVVDRDGRTSDPMIFAAGDCARRPLIHYASQGRLESVHNAVEQGRLVAAAIAGKERPAEDCPWFWSDQYDLKLQIAGLSQGYDETVIRGDPATAKFAVFYLARGRLIATDAVASPLEFMMSKKLISVAARVDPSLLADESVSMKDIVAQHG